MPPTWLCYENQPTLFLLLNIILYVLLRDQEIIDLV